MTQTDGEEETLYGEPKREGNAVIIAQINGFLVFWKPVTAAASCFPEDASTGVFFPYGSYSHFLCTIPTL